MPDRDGTGPVGQGAARGRGRGFCAGRNAAEADRYVGGRRGQGIFCRRGGRVGNPREEAARLEKTGRPPGEEGEG